MTIGHREWGKEKNLEKLVGLQLALMLHRDKNSRRKLASFCHQWVSLPGFWVRFIFEAIYMLRTYKLDMYVHMYFSCITLTSLFRIDSTMGDVTHERWKMISREKPKVYFILHLAFLINLFSFYSSQHLLECFWTSTFLYQSDFKHRHLYTAV